jgi:hypothetical protein
MTKNSALLHIITLVAGISFVGNTQTLPQLPKSFINTTYSLPTGKTYTVNAGGNLQAALDSAKLGDVIVLQAGATFTGPYTLPNKTSGSGWIYIQSSNYASLPGTCDRVSQADSVNMPKIVVAAGAGGAIQTANNAHHFRFVGIELRPVSGNFVYDLVTIGNADTSVATLPHDIIFDRCYLHGDSVVGGRRAIEMDGISIAVVNCFVSDFKEAGSDTQGLWAYNTPGPLKVVNNFLEASTENTMFGGEDPNIKNMVVSDIEIRYNHFFKPMAWKGSSWQVKNLLEFKNAQRVLVEGNRFENNWAANQNGMSLLLTPRNQSGTAPWCITQDITIRMNTFVNIEQGFNILGTDTPNVSQRTHRVLIENNIVLVTGSGSDGRIFGIVGGPVDLIIRHNTAFSAGPMGFCEDFTKVDTFYFENNIITNGSYGFSGTSTGEGLSTLNYYFTDWTFTKNAIIGGTSGPYPANNFFPIDTTAVGFVNFAGNNYNLSITSPYKNAATDGNDIGANMVDSINIMDTCAMSGKCGCNGTLTAAPTLSPVSNSILVYPNPSNGRFAIQPSVVNDQSSVYVYNVLGEVVFSEFTIHHSPFTININNQPNGIYFVKVVTNTSSQVVKLIKQ